MSAASVSQAASVSHQKMAEICHFGANCKNKANGKCTRNHDVVPNCRYGTKCTNKDCNRPGHDQEPAKKKVGYQQKHMNHHLHVPLHQGQLPMQMQMPMQMPMQPQMQMQMPMQPQMQMQMPMPMQAQMQMPMPMQAQMQMPMPMQPQMQMPMPMQPQMPMQALVQRQQAETQAYTHARMQQSPMYVPQSQVFAPVPQQSHVHQAQVHQAQVQQSHVHRPQASASPAHVQRLQASAPPAHVQMHKCHHLHCGVMTELQFCPHHAV